MATIAPQTSFQPPPSSRSDPSPNKLLFSTCRLSSASSGLRRTPASFLSHSLSRHYDHASCRCSSNGVAGGGGGIADDSSGDERWDRAVQDVFRGAMRKLEDLRESFLNWNMDRSVGPEEGYGGDMDEWDWGRWKKHFCDVDDQEKIVSILKSQLATAVNSENYKDAAKLKVAIAAAATNDTIGKVMSHLNRALQEEEYEDAALLRDYAGAGLVGWWAGISENTRDPHGCIIHISAEHGRYVARSYSPRQLVSALDGSPVFEIFFTKTNKGEFKQQAVYLKRPKTSSDFPIPLKSSKLPKKFDPLNPTDDKRSLLDENTEDPDNDESDEESSFENTLRDIIPGVKVKVLNVITPNKLDKDFISKVVDQIIDGEDEEEDIEVDNADSGDEVTSESDEEQENIILDADNELRFGEEQSQIAVKVVVGGLLSRSSGTAKKDLLRVPAKLEKKDRLSFTFTVEEEDDNKSGENGKAPPSKKAKLQDQLSVDSVMLDIAKFIGKGRIPRKVLKDVGELINFTLSQAQNRQPLSGATRFSRIDIPGNQDPLNGLYVGAHGLHASEVIHLRRRVGQWKEDGLKKDPLNLEFYEYVEAVKVTGDPYVPAGQIAFRAKVGQRYQLPHKGIIPEEFGVIARYKGQGRLAEPGFRNPRWVDGELVVLDGKYIKGGPVVGFVYWAPEFHFLVFFNRLRLHE